MKQKTVIKCFEKFQRKQYSVTKKPAIVWPGEAADEWREWKLQ